jgi:hypothetical protein
LSKTHEHFLNFLAFLVLTFHALLVLGENMKFHYLPVRFAQFRVNLCTHFTNLAKRGAFYHLPQLSVQPSSYIKQKEICVIVCENMMCGLFPSEIQKPLVFVNEEKCCEINVTDLEGRLFISRFLWKNISFSGKSSCVHVLETPL